MHKKNGYYVNKHSCFLLQYHLVLVTKFRKPAITEEVKDFLVSYTEKYFKEHDLNLIEINTQEDHVHILFEAPPQINLSVLVNNYKAVTSRLLRKNFDFSKWYYKPFFWSLSYFICTVSDRNLEAVQHYIQNQ